MFDDDDYENTWGVKLSISGDNLDPDEITKPPSLWASCPRRRLCHHL